MSETQCAVCSMTLPAEARVCPNCETPRKWKLRLNPFKKYPEHKSTHNATVFAIANHLGPVGKTTTAINLAAYLAEAGRKSLVVDISTNAHATKFLGVDEHTVGTSVSDLLASNETPASDAIMSFGEARPNLDLLPSKPCAWVANAGAGSLRNRELQLKKIVDCMRGSYDFILIDCPSSLEVLAVNGLVAADATILPVECGAFSLEDMLPLMYAIQRVQPFNPSAHLFGVVLTKFDPSTRLATEKMATFRQYFPREKFESLIPLTRRAAEASGCGKTLAEHDPRSPAALAYKRLAEEVIARTATLRRPV